MSSLKQCCRCRVHAFATQVAKSIEHAAQERQQAVNKATKQITMTIDHTHIANGKAKRDAARAVNKALGLRS